MLVGMVLTQSTMLSLGTPAPDFALPDTSGRTVRLAEFAGAKALVVMFLSNHCPFVQHIQSGLVALAREYQARGVAFVAVASNDQGTHPQDGPTEMIREAQTAGYTFPYVFDAEQQVAKAYRSRHTPRTTRRPRSLRRPAGHFPPEGHEPVATAAPPWTGTRPVPRGVPHYAQEEARPDWCTRSGETAPRCPAAPGTRIDSCQRR